MTVASCVAQSIAAATTIADGKLMPCCYYTLPIKVSFRPLGAPTSFLRFL
jgi:hypothetical protein